MLAPMVLAGDVVDAWRGPLLAGVFGLLSAMVAYWQATRQAAGAARNEARRIDAEAYERAKRGIDEERPVLRAEVTQLRAEVDTERLGSARLRARVVELEDEVARLRRRLIVAGIDEGGPVPG